MQTQQRQIHLGSEALADARHICALFDGPEDAYSVVLPFVAEGLNDGDRVIYLTENPEQLRGRLRPHLDPARTDSGQLDFRPWAQTYLVDGTFIGSRMLAYVRQALGEGTDLGYPATRLIGEMEWAQGDVCSLRDLVTYESGIDAILGRPPHTLVCAYDVRRHNASRIAAVLGVHRAAFVGGRLQRTNGNAVTTTPR
ncbi:MAG: hypothetical protein E6J50_07535, partial [Chloroflexi bacterium]